MEKGIILNKKKINYVALVLDKSSSMKPITDEIINMFNENINTLKEETKDMETKVCLIVFSTYNEQEQVLWCKSIGDVKLLNRGNYIPHGMTAMYDAIGYTLNRLSEETKNSTEDISFLVTVISDGEENNSKAYTAKRISAMINERNEDGRWTITYIGANQDLSVVSKDIKVRADATLAFEADAAGTRFMSNISSTGIKKYYDGRRKGYTSIEAMYDGSTVVDDDS